jgi:hypothetical protein
MLNFGELKEGPYRMLYFLILSCLIFISSVEGGIPSLAAAPFGLATFPLLSARAASISSFSLFWRALREDLMTLHLRESTIHKQFDSRDVATVVRCQKHHGFGSLIGRSEPSERNGLGDHLFAFLAYRRRSQ